MTDADFQQLAADTRLAESPGGVAVLRAYQDSKGIWTIGYGTNLQELTITPQLADEFLAQMLARSEAELHRSLPWAARLSSRRQRAFVEMIYNMGLGKFLGFHRMLAAAERGEWTAAAAEALDSDWAYDVGDRRARRIAGMILAG